METLSSLLSFQEKENVFDKFETAAHDLVNNWMIKRNGQTFQILEIEFFLRSEKLNHLDPFIDGHAVQQTFGHWMLLMSGVELTIGEKNRYASVRIRSIRNLTSGKLFNGPQRVFKELFEDAGSALLPNNDTHIVRVPSTEKQTILAVPRVGLNFTEFSNQLEERMRYLLKPYRFVSTSVGDIADKYVALLYLEKVGKNDHLVSPEHTIFKKYLHAFDIGCTAANLDVVWEERSKSLRLGRLMGYMKKRNDLIVPEVSNVNLTSSEVKDIL